MAKGIQNKSGEIRAMSGDKRLLIEVNKENPKRCRAAVQASIDEVYIASEKKYY